MADETASDYARYLEGGFQLGGIESTFSLSDVTKESGQKENLLCRTLIILIVLSEL